MTRILVVDDDAVALRIMRHTLTKNDYDVESASNGFEALQFVTEMTFDLMIFDISMPDMNGIELLTKVRQLPQTSDTPVIMLTASSQDENRVHAENAGANLYLTKPISSRQMIESVESLL